MYLHAIGMAVAVFACLTATAGATRDATPTRFYLDVKAGQCVKGAARKHFAVLACSNPSHQYEVFAVLHGGWNKAAPSQHGTIFAIAAKLCPATFQQKYGARIDAPYGWWGFWPDAGAESAKYGDRLICTLIRWPGHPAMGAGTHFR
jgi:hypothetical protein